MALALHAGWAAVGAAGALEAVGQTLAVIAVSFVLLCLLVSFVRFQTLTRALAVRAPAAPTDEALHFEMLRRLSTAHRVPNPFALLLLGVEELERLTAEHGAEFGLGALEFLRSGVAARVRKTDATCVFRGRCVAAVVDAARPSALAIAHRLAEALCEAAYRTRAGLWVRLPVRIGLASYPENGDRVPVLIEAAESALAQAAREGQLVAQAAESDAIAKGSAPSAKPSADARGWVDPLTGVLRSDRVPGAVPKYVAAHRKEGRPVAMLYVDVDGLRRYNDHYGRAAGDALLKELGAWLDTHVREGDLIARYGEDDFLVLMPGTAREGSVVAQRICVGVRNLAVASGGARLRFSVSIGVAACPEHGARPGPIFEAAAAALRAAKARGGGRSMVYERAMRCAPAHEPVGETF